MGLVTGSKREAKCMGIEAVTEDTVSVLRGGLGSDNKNKMGVVTSDHSLVDTEV